MVKFIKELHGDLEMVYVGQLCLSWEFLHWQYERALELWESDRSGIHTYNEVAGEFQQFQVLMQRFMENEPYQAPRVENYVQNRCVLRNLLQVPVMRGDCFCKTYISSQELITVIQNFPFPSYCRGQLEGEKKDEKKGTRH